MATATATDINGGMDILTAIYNKMSSMENKLDNLAESKKCDIVNIGGTKAKALMYNKERILKLHYKRYGQLKVGKDKRYYCYIPTEEGKKLIRKTRLEDIESVILLLEEYQDLKVRVHSFKDVFLDWVEYKEDLDLQRGNTIYRYKTTYKRFFTNNAVNPYVAKIENQPISKISLSDLEMFLSVCVNGLDKTKPPIQIKAFNNLWSILNQIFKFAIRNSLIDKNPLDYIDKKAYVKKCKKPNYEQQNNIVISDDLKKILQVIQERHEKSDKTKFDLMTEVKVYANELIAYTGLRPAEVSALKWSNVYLTDCNDGYYGKMVIQYSMKECDDGYRLEGTKTGKIRTIPIDSKVKAIFDGMEILSKKLKKKCDDFIFLEYKHEKIEPISPKAIGRCLERLCKEAKVESISPTTLRKSVNTRMKYNGISDLVCCAILGNTPEVNNRHYTYDGMCTEIDKMGALRQANLKL